MTTWRSAPRLIVVLVACALGLFALAACATGPVSHTYQTVLDQPCVACHTTGVSSDLNARGQAFAGSPDYQANPQAAWATAVQAVPLQTSSSDGASVLVPIVVAVLLVAWLYRMVRRRQSATRSR